MKVIHGTWIPDASTEFIQAGSFYLWVETPIKTQAKTNKNIHPGHLSKDELVNFLIQDVGIKETVATLSQRISPKYFALPTADNTPLPSPEMTRYLEEADILEYDSFQYWQVDCYKTVVSVKLGSKYSDAVNISQFLNEIHFLALYNTSEIQLGSDLLFWYHYTQAFKQVILKDHYIPALKYRQLSSETSTKKGKQQAKNILANNTFEIYATWEIISEEYESNLKRYVEYMPLICVSGTEVPHYEDVHFFERESLLRHFSEYLLHDIVTHTPSTVAFDKQIDDSLVNYCFYAHQYNPLKSNISFEEFKQWSVWKQKITRTSHHASSLIKKTLR
jgi:hypothetical protein